MMRESYCYYSGWHISHVHIWVHAHREIYFGQCGNCIVTNNNVQLGVLCSYEILVEVELMSCTSAAYLLCFTHLGHASTP